MSPRAVTLICVGILALAAGTLGLRAEPAAESSVRPESLERVTAAPAATPVVTRAASPFEAAASGSPVAEVAKEPKAAVKVELSESDRSALSELTRLRRKVILTDEEQRRQRELMKEESFLSRLGEIFTPDSDESVQNEALDLLLEAREQYESRAAAEALRSIVADAVIENDAIPFEARKRLAGIKAEVLFRWTAAEPLYAPALRAILPGQVSHAIMDNVQARQATNLAESLAPAPHDP